MLTNKYCEEFLESYDEVVNKKQIVKNIMQTEEKTGVELLQWDEVQLAIFLNDSSSVSIAGVNKNLVVLRVFANFICDKENMPKREYVKGEDSLLDYVDKESLKARTLSYEQYMDIKNQLNMVEGGQRINVRDSVIFELAWEGAMREEIQNLKEKNIEFLDTENGKAAILTFATRMLRVDSPEVVEDIRLCMKETYCMKQGRAGFYNKYNYRDSEYLIKPANVGRTNKEGNISSLSITFAGILKSNDIRCTGIDVDSLGLNDIRRSKMIYLLAPENANIFDIPTILGMFNLSSPNSLLWLKEIAEEIYKK